MAQPRSAEAVRAEYASSLIDAAYEIREKYNAVLAERKSNREDLRNMVGQGFLDDEQRAEFEELYPPRSRKAEEAEEAGEGTPEEGDNE